MVQTHLMGKTDARVDAYIQKAAPFAQPILLHLRSVVHEACPGVEETIKWRNPSFDYKGIFCGMAAFKAHATFGFWKDSVLVKRLPASDAKALSQLARITTLDELPAKKTLVRIVKAAATLNDEGIKMMRPKGAPRAAPRPPADLAAALAKNPQASATFTAFSPSQKREYVDWIVEAKQAATRAKRLATAVEWIAEGKERNWKYVR
jgi:uncharacterized protein YdeI (YjbR/CyaY-like superfamily)